MQVVPEGNNANTLLQAVWLDFNPGNPWQLVHAPISATFSSASLYLWSHPNQHKKLADMPACLLYSHTGPPEFSTTSNITASAAGPQTTVLVTAPTATWPNGSSNAVTCNTSATNQYPVGSSLIVCYTSDTATGYMETVSFWINVGEAATFSLCFMWSLPVSANMQIASVCEHAAAFTQSSIPCCALGPLQAWNV